MALGSDTIDLLILLRRKGFLPAQNAAVLEIGAQQLAQSFIEARELLANAQREFSVQAACPVAARENTSTYVVHGSLKHLDAAAPMARDFWQWLGFAYASIDIDGSPGSIPLDLNFDDVPATAKGRHHLVTNFGTTEHVANQLNAFKIIHELTAPGGVMWHILPSQGMYNHGLVNYNPKFFWMLARSNGYEVVYMDYGSYGASYALPQNIVDFVSGFRPDISKRGQDYMAADSRLVVMLRKTYDIPYVPPLDVPTGAQVDNAVLKERYWTVFEPDAFSRLRDKRVNLPEPWISRAKRKLKMKLKKLV